MMKWFFENRRRHSEKNGTIVARRRLGVWYVNVDRCEQTGPSVHRMWQDAYARVKRLLADEPKKILLLGLGGGGELAMLGRLFPQASITVVEHDREMITLAEELRLFRPSPRITIIEADAKEALARLGRFDIVTVDIFRGRNPSPLITDDVFLERLERCLTRNGLLVVNIYRHVAYLDKLRERSAHSIIWKFETNTLGIFRPANADRLKALPDGFVPYMNWPEFDFTASIPRIFQPGKIGGATPGTRWALWPLSFEKYIGDTEPVPSHNPQGPIRVILWHRLLWADAPPGWIAAALPYRTIGFSELTETPYFEAWSATARRNRRQWLEQYEGVTYLIRPLTFDEFVKAYRTGSLDKATRTSTLETELYSRYRTNKGSMIFWGAERLQDKTIAAGMAVIDSPTCKGSYYLAGFYTHAARKDPVMAGLFDHWFRESGKKSLRFLHFGDFWQPGKPLSWKGFSNFKAKFGPRYLIEPPTLYRFERTF